MVSQCASMGRLPIPWRIHLQAPFCNRVLTPQMQAYNSAMSEVRSSVEWLLGTSSIISSFRSSKKKSEDWAKHCGENVCGVCNS